MNNEEVQLSRVLVSVVPPLPAPADRVGAVAARVRRQRTVTALATAAGVAGIVLAVGLPTLLAVRDPGPAPEVIAAPQATPSQNPGLPHTAGCGTSPSSRATSIDGTPQPINQRALDDVATRLRPAAETRFADVFADLEMRHETNRIRVFRKPSAAFDAWIRGEFAGVCVEMADARYSARELQNVADRVEADMKYWRNRGIQINVVGAGVDRITIGVDPAHLDDARRVMPGRYHPVLIVVEAQGPMAW